MASSLNISPNTKLQDYFMTHFLRQLKPIKSKQAAAKNLSLYLKAGFLSTNPRTTDYVSLYLSTIALQLNTLSLYRDDGQLLLRLEKSHPSIKSRLYSADWMDRSSSTPQDTNMQYQLTFRLDIAQLYVSLLNSKICTRRNHALPKAFK